MDGKAVMVCDQCGYSKEFADYAEAEAYLGGRGKIYGWSWQKSELKHGDQELFCPTCSDPEINPEMAEIVKMRLEMFP
jgi:hypothetical protein